MINTHYYAKRVGIILGIIMLFFVLMSSFVFFYNKAVEKGILVIVSEHQFQNNDSESYNKKIME